MERVAIKTATWVMGRADDVINVSGHRLGTMEIESALRATQLLPKGRLDDWMISRVKALLPSSR